MKDLHTRVTSFVPEEPQSPLQGTRISVETRTIERRINNHLAKCGLIYKRSLFHAVHPNGVSRNHCLGKAYMWHVPCGTARQANGILQMIITCWWFVFGKQYRDWKSILSSMSIKTRRSIKTRTSITQISTVKYGWDFPQATMSNVGSLSLECVDKHFGIHISLLTHNLLKTQKVSNLHGASMLSQPRYIVEFMIQSDHGSFS